MDEYQYALMKQTLERIQKRVTMWREVDEAMQNGTECNYEVPEGVGDDMLYEIETILDEAGFHE